MLNKIQLFMFSVFLIGGLIIAFISLKGLYHSHQASSWNSVQGKIIDLKIQTSLGSRSPERATTSSRHLKYSYAVKNQYYTGSKEYFGIVIGTNNKNLGSQKFGVRSFHATLSMTKLSDWLIKEPNFLLFCLTYCPLYRVGIL